MTPNAAVPPINPSAVLPGAPWLPVRALPVVDSTNAEVARDPRMWSVVVAERQDAGRGRLGRPWTTTPGTSLAVSVLVPPPPAGTGWVPLLAGLAAHLAVTKITGLETVLKWPNDLLVPSESDRKLAGILCEWHPEGVIVGLGLNVGAERDDLPLPTATSLRAAGAGPVAREELLTAWLRELATLLVEPADTSAARYRAVCGTIGTRVRVEEPVGVSWSGTAIGVDNDGRLVVRTGERTRHVAAGDVLHVRPG